MSQAGPTSVVPVEAGSSQIPRVVGILAGGGSIPREVAQSVVASGRRVHIVAINGEADDAELARFPLTRVGWGQIGAMVSALHEAQCDALVIVGSVRRPDLSALRPDLGFFASLPAIVRIITAGGDDGVLTRVVRFFEDKGFRVVGPGTVAPELLVGAGPMGAVAADDQASGDVAEGFALVQALGPYDVGQAVVVTNGRIEAIEGAEGTDAMLRRVAHARAAAPKVSSASAGSGVLVKRPKPGQELRIDMPAIGPGTLTRAADAGLAGVGVLAGCTLAAERAEVVRIADEKGLFVQGFADAVAVPLEAGPQIWNVRHHGKTKITSRSSADAAKGAALLSVLSSLMQSRGVVVNRGHVLAVESGEGVGELVRRGGGLHQWGRWHRARASGAIVVSAAEDLEQALDEAAAAGLAGVALAGHPPPQLLHAIARADEHGLYLATVTLSGGTR